MNIKKIVIITASVILAGVLVWSLFIYKSAKTTLPVPNSLSTQSVVTPPGHIAPAQTKAYDALYKRWQANTKKTTTTP
ncbi:MAG: hypothetical protein Q7S66_01400 [bacterium]|nr:hypothetical protein [bacterium]